MFYASAKKKKKKKKKKNTVYPNIQVALAVFFYAYRVTLRFKHINCVVNH